MGAKALLGAAAVASSALSVRGIAGRPADAPVQMKKVLKGQKVFADKGTLTVDFEERLQGSSAGLYGVVAFLPDKDSKAVADRIDLVQIASLRSNDQDNKEFDTSGTALVKDMWRVDGKYHLDLLGSEAGPRTSSEAPQIQHGYNSERRDKNEEAERLDLVTMSDNEKVLDQYSVEHANREKKKLADTTTRKIAQHPGFNKGNGEVGITELFDFPKSRKPAIASFHTTVDADRKPWGTVKWGFTSEENLRESSMEVASIQGPQFEEGQSAEMEDARSNFNAIMANSASWTSPEAYEEVVGLLKSNSEEDYHQGKIKLWKMADALERTIEKIHLAWKQRPSKLQKEEKPDLAKFLLPHVDMLDAVLNALWRAKQDKDQQYVRLSKLFEEAKILLK